MATNLRGTDVVVIGLGAAGGVGVLPLAQAGVEVIGLEAGGQMSRRDFAPDEIRNNVRGWPMLTSHKTNQEAPTFRARWSSHRLRTRRSGQNLIMIISTASRAVPRTAKNRCAFLSQECS